jgi:two-component system, chemotaxis family, sensor kinase Cph1
MTSLDFISQVKQSIANLTDPKLAPSDLSLTSCDREPIHISNAIQPHGVLLTFCESVKIQRRFWVKQPMRFWDSRSQCC